MTSYMSRDIFKSVYRFYDVWCVIASIKWTRHVYKKLFKLIKCPLWKQNFRKQ